MPKYVRACPSLFLCFLSICYYFLVFLIFLVFPSRYFSVRLGSSKSLLIVILRAGYGWLVYPVLFCLHFQEDEEFGKLHHISLAIVGLLSTAVFTNALPWWGYLAALLNLGALILVPTHMKKDDNNLNSTSSLNSSQEVLPTRVV